MTQGEDRTARTAPVLTGLTLFDGVFSAMIGGSAREPAVDLVVDGAVVASARAEAAGDDAWRIEARLPRQCLRDGVTAVIFVDRPSHAQLAAHVVRAGPEPEEDLVAEIAVLRAELDALKRAFLGEAWHEKLRAAERPVIVAEVLEAVERHLSGRGTDGTA